MCPEKPPTAFAPRYTSYRGYPALICGTAVGCVKRTMCGKKVVRFTHPTRFGREPWHQA